MVSFVFISCNHKHLLQDNLIERLANEVRQADNSSVVVLEAEQMITKSASEEYNRLLTPLHVPSSDEVILNYFHSVLLQVRKQKGLETIHILLVSDVTVGASYQVVVLLLRFNKWETILTSDDVFQDDVILGDMPPLVSASVLQSGSDTYGSDVLGSEEKPKASTNQIEALIEQRISDGTRVSSLSDIKSKFLSV